MSLSLMSNNDAAAESNGETATGNNNEDDMGKSLRMAAAMIASVAASSSSSLSNQQAEAVATAASDDGDDDSFTWTTKNIILSLTLFVLAGIAEIGGGWLVWRAVRGHSDDGKAQPPFWWAIVGSIVLVIYGFLPTLQPTDSFGRLYAVYGGFFIVLSFLAGWLLDGDRPDIGDVVGGTISLVGVLIILFWPR